MPNTTKKLNIREDRIIHTIGPEGNEWAMEGLDHWETLQTYRYRTRVIWRCLQTGEIVIVPMEQEASLPAGKTGGMKKASALMEKMGRPCEGRWDKSEYREELKQTILLQRAKNVPPVFSLEDVVEEPDSEGGE